MYGAALLGLGQILLAIGISSSDTASGGIVAATGLYLFLTIFNGECSSLASLLKFSLELS